MTGGEEEDSGRGDAAQNQQLCFDAIVFPEHFLLAISASSTQKKADITTQACSADSGSDPDAAVSYWLGVLFVVT